MFFNSFNFLLNEICRLVRDKKTKGNVSKEVNRQKNLAIKCFQVRKTDKIDSGVEKEKPKVTDSELICECPICFEDLAPPTKIYACKEDHLVCDKCLEEWKRKKNNCPECRQDFNQIPPERRIDYENAIDLAAFNKNT